MTEDVIKAESSAAVATPEFNPADQNTWSPEQREHWNTTGEQPVLPKKTQEPEPGAAPAKEAKSEVAEATKTAAESETAPKQEKRERKSGEKLSAEERIAQLTAKNREIEAELKAERERSRATEPKPSAEPAKQAEAPKRPNPFNWKGTAEEYDAAVELYEAHQRQQAVLEFQRNELARAQNQKLQGQLDEVKAKYPDAEDKIRTALADLGKAPLPGVFRAMFDDSDVLPELMYVLSDETTRKNFIEIATSQTPGKAVRALAQMEADIRSKQSTSAEPEKKSESKPPAELKPRAPKPPSEVGGRGAAGEDALRAAAAANDFAGFEAEQNRRKFVKPN